MTAFYLTSTSQDTLTAMLITMQGNQPVMAYQNALGPLPAVPAVASYTDAQGNVIPAQPAKGVAGYYYLSINLPDVTGTAVAPAVFPAALPSGVSEDDTNGIAVLGVWA